MNDRDHGQKKVEKITIITNSDHDQCLWLSKSDLDHDSQSKIAGLQYPVHIIVLRDTHIALRQTQVHRYH